MEEMNKLIVEDVAKNTLEEIKLKSGTSTTARDPSKVDRSAAYACWQMAKSVVKNGLCKRALLQLSCAIGAAKPVPFFVIILVKVHLRASYTSS